MRRIARLAQNPISLGLALLLTLAAPASASAQDHVEATTEILRSVEDVLLLSFDDRVTDGCLPRPKKVTDAIELSIRSAQIPVTTAWKNRKTIVIKAGAVGLMAHSNAGQQLGCVVTLIFHAEALSDHETELWGYLLKFDYNVLVGDKASMPDRLSGLAREYADELMLEVLRAKQQ